MLKKSVDWNWSPECEQAMKDINEALASPPILAAPILKNDPNFTPYLLQTDASDHGIGFGHPAQVRRII